MTSFDVIAFNWNLKNLLKLFALCELIWPFYQQFKKKLVRNIKTYQTLVQSLFYG